MPSTDEIKLGGEGKEEMLPQHRIPKMPPTMYYIPDFITKDEADYIAGKIPANRWITLSHRRLQAVPTQLTANNTLLPSPLPTWLKDPVVERIEALSVFKDAPHGINHCLINEYEPGQGIMSHEDGAAYYPVVATVSLGGTLVLDVTEKSTEADVEVAETPRKSWRILQEPRSLLLTTGLAYTDTLHGIADVMEDSDLEPDTVANWELLDDSTRGAIKADGGCSKRSTRISLTCRDVKKVSRVGAKIFGRTR